MIELGLSGAVAAIGALGTASYGLVDASKAAWGGPSRFGFGYIKKGIKPFTPGLAVVGARSFLDDLRDLWLNGVPLEDQKAKAKAMIHLGLTGANAKTLGEAVGFSGTQFDPARPSPLAAFVAAVQKIDTGTPLAADEITIIGRFDAILSAKLDAAFERADQVYRNMAKILACAVSVALALGCNAALGAADMLPFWEAFLIGLVATPLAPVAKDLSSALSATTAALSAVKR